MQWLWNIFGHSPQVGIFKGQLPLTAQQKISQITFQMYGTNTNNIK